MKKIIAIIALFVIMFSLAFPVYAEETPSPSPSDDGGYSSGGGYGRRDWLDKNAPDFVDDGSNLDAMDNAIGTHIVSNSGLIYKLYFYMGPGTPNGSPSYPTVISRTYGYDFSLSVQTYNSLTQYFYFEAKEDGTSVNFPFAFYYTLNGDFVSDNISLNGHVSGTRTFATAGNYDFTNILSGASVANAVYHLSGSVYMLIEPVDTAILTNYDSSSRIGSISGDVVVIGNDNKTTVYKDCQFVDEDNSRFYCPTTNNWTTYNSYSYDYSTLTYNFTDVDNNTYSISYGDEYITYSETVNNVTNVYNYYYYTETEPADPDTCDHTFTSEITREPSCTMPGIVTYTCTKCGYQYTETIDPLGHDWLLKESVPTTYSVDTTSITCPDDGTTNFTYTLDEATETYTFTNANTGYTWTVPAVVTHGYDLYVCSRCGEEYRDYSGSGPPDEESGLFAAIGDFIANGITWILDKLKKLVEAMSGINQAFSSYIESLKEVGGNYPLFISAVVDALPSDLMNVIWFGVIALAAVFAYKKFFK